MIPFNIPYKSGGELQNLEIVLKSSNFSGNGFFAEKVKKKLNELYGFEHVFLTSSCTAAIELCVLALNLQKGDEVIIPSYTFASTPTPFIRAQCDIVFADCKPDYPNLEIKSILSKITSNTKVIMTMHYGGASDDVEELSRICTEKGIVMIEDAAQAIDSVDETGALGSFGDFSVFSFHETKNITCGEGGILVVNNSKYLAKAEQVYQYGTNRNDFLNGTVNKYEWVSVGVSQMMSEISASFLYAQLGSIKEVTKRRKDIYNQYYTELKSIDNWFVTIPNPPKGRSNYHTFFILVTSQKLLLELAAFMKTKKVSCVTHYTPLHSSDYAISHNLRMDNLENTTYFGQHLLRLPLYFELSNFEINQVTSFIKEFFENHK